MGLLSGISSLFGIGMAIDDRREQKKQQALDNDYRQDMMDYNREQFEYQKQENALNRERQDNAYQRTVEDMRKAGLSPSMLSGGVNESVVSPSVNSPTSVSGGIAPSSSGIIQSISDANNFKIQKDSLDFEKLKHSEDLAEKIREIDEEIALREKMHEDTKALEEERNRLQAWSNQITSDAQKETARENQVRDKQANLENWSNLIERGTIANNSGSKSWNAGVNATVTGMIKGGVNGGTSESGNYAQENPFEKYYTSADVPLLAEKFDSSKTSIYFRGDVPCFVTTDPNNKNNVLVYDPTLPGSKSKLHSYNRNDPAFKNNYVTKSN